MDSVWDKETMEVITLILFQNGGSYDSLIFFAWKTRSIMDNYKGGDYMVLFTILMLILLILLVVTIVVASVIGAGTIIVFGDVIIFIILLGYIIYRIFLKKKKK